MFDEDRSYFRFNGRANSFQVVGGEAIERPVYIVGLWLLWFWFHLGHSYISNRDVFVLFLGLFACKAICLARIDLVFHS
ncbi:hypothetical protein [Mesorhizobium sp. M0130]|uniref:hypothetical protein n=1 Tax=Mesorhizobium sp. M0130 TaxID=2956887 RepID=UPI003335678E